MTVAMNRFFLIVLVAGAVVIGAGVLFLGAFPPNPNPHPVQRVLPNDKFVGH
jgi:hypothetical protein